MADFKKSFVRTLAAVVISFNVLPVVFGVENGSRI